MVNAVILAAGMGSRMNYGYNKQFIKINNKEILAYTLEAFNKCEDIDNIVIVASKNEVEYIKENVVTKYNIDKVKSITVGGDTRQESVYNGLKKIGDPSIVVIHDGARPFINKDIIKESINKAYQFGASTTGVKVKDTIKKGENNIFTETVDRTCLYSIQTPQSFKRDIILKCHEKAREEGFEATDDSMIVEKYGYSVSIVEGDYFNIKITTREDIFIGEGIIKALGRIYD
ncbi:MAG: 2-C-methyl-D-erythritol 4-phosphate cytidylyltransferase [Clostridium sp.]|uniref:2-C-methyl-D-erythritol 4-phosphate cytidylyltransferase n=1 Tax=Clostridium sp. TaxID=1506 RepID=UPI002FC6E6EA